MKYNKYKNTRVTINFTNFQSKKEASRYLILKKLLEKREIENLRLQVPFLLQDKFRYKNKTIRAIKYIADFTYYKNGELIVEDVKGFRTNIYKLKIKIFKKLNQDLDFREI